MLSHRSLAALRVAATLTHTLPDVGARVRLGRRVLLEVQPKAPDPPPVIRLGPKVITPCAFRCAAAQARQRELAGERLSFLGLPEGSEPSIDIATPRTGAALPGGIYRVPHEGHWMWGMATTLEPDVAYEIGLDLVESTLPLDELHVLGLRPDPGTGVTVAYATTSAAPHGAEEAALVDLMVGLLARWTAHELMGAAQDPRDAQDARRSTGTDDT
jgi:hypothetical protein